MALSLDPNFTFNGIPDEEYLKPRWQQEGSVLKNIFYSSMEDDTIYTPATGNTIYITTIVFHATEANDGDLDLKDGGAAGTTKIALKAPLVDTTYTVNLSTPLAFSTNIYGSSDQIFRVTLIGWESET